MTIGLARAFLRSPGLIMCGQILSCRYFKSVALTSECCKVNGQCIFFRWRHYQPKYLLIEMKSFAVSMAESLTGGPFPQLMRQKAIQGGSGLNLIFQKKFSNLLRRQDMIRKHLRK